MKRFHGAFVIAVCVPVLLATTSKSKSEFHDSSKGWPRISSDVVEAMNGSLTCSDDSLDIGFCRYDQLLVPEKSDAKLADGCRGQPLNYLSQNVRNKERSILAKEISLLFQRPEFRDLGHKIYSLKEKLQQLHDIDQILRFWRPKTKNISLESAYYSKWIPICAFSRYSQAIVKNILDGLSVDALSADRELALYVWVLAQHSDFDPLWQASVAEFFLQSEKAFMTKHAAYLIDRSLTAQNRLQRYGTQLRCVDGKRVPFPIENPEIVDKRRASVGLASLSQYLQGFPRPCPKEASKDE